MFLQGKSNLFVLGISGNEHLSKENKKNKGKEKRQRQHCSDSVCLSKTNSPIVKNEIKKHASKRSSNDCPLNAGKYRLFQVRGDVFWE